MDTQVSLYTIIVQVIIIVFSVVIHEVAHGYAAYREGDLTAYYQGRLTLNPLKHLELFGSFILPVLLFSFGLPVIAWAKPVPYNPYNFKNKKSGTIKVALAGVACNISIAFLFGILSQVLLMNGLLTPNLSSIINITIIINIILTIFNLIPIPPLDGSKVLGEILPESFLAKIAQYERYSLIFLFVFIMFFWQLVYPVVSFIFIKSTTFLL